MSKKLTDKQERFCKEYMLDLNATQAAIRAGYSKNTAPEIGCENLIKPNIQEKIQELKAKVSEKYDIKQEDLIRELKNWAYGDFTELMELSFLEIKELPEELRRLITGFERTITSGDNPSEKLKVTFVDKKAAIDMIAKMIGAYEKDNNQKKTDISIPNLSNLTYEQLKELAKGD